MELELQQIQTRKAELEKEMQTISHTILDLKKESSSLATELLELERKEMKLAQHLQEKDRKAFLLSLENIRSLLNMNTTLMARIELKQENPKDRWGNSTLWDISITTKVHVDDTSNGIMFDICIRTIHPEIESIVRNSVCVLSSKGLESKSPDQRIWIAHRDWKKYVSILMSS